MNKAKKVFCVALSAFLSASVAFAAVACGETDTPPNPDNNNEPPVTAETYQLMENRPLVLSTSEADGVFNPFFSTSAVDSNIISMTQIGLLSADKEGKIVCGENEPTAALDYSERTLTEGSQDYTYYQFVIKNGIKFSDGVDLTINDILFNLYVYLDPAYTGSATMYSTDIVGLNDYRYQRRNITDGQADQLEAQFQATARTRVNELVQYVYSQSRFTPEADRGKYDISDWDAAKIAQAEADFVTVGNTFREELGADYSSISGTLESYKTSNEFTETWQVFLVNDGGINLYKHNSNGTIYKDGEGNYKYDPDCNNAVEAKSDLADYLAEKNVTATTGTEYENAVRDWAIDYVYYNTIGEAYGTSTAVQMTNGTSFETVARYWGTAETILTEFTAEARSASLGTGTLAVPSITGITTHKGSYFTASDKSTGSNYSDDYDVLQIKIKGVDPKAIYNFSFSVAPRHYYSSSSYVSERTGLETDYVNGWKTDSYNFGVDMGKPKFMKEVVNASSKIGVPLGAGVYQATDGNDSDFENVTASGFKDIAGIVYFKRNENFTTVGAGIENAKIKHLRFALVNSDQIINSLSQGNIDFGEPSATDKNITTIRNLGNNYSYDTVWTNGYGYVGVNARYVPNITVRRAIMKAMNLDLIINDYYTDDLAQIITRSMSKTSWAYPNAPIYTSTDNGTSYAYDPTGNEIKAMLNGLTTQGYTPTGPGGVLTKGNDTLDYTMTIAGGTTDHPAYSMFMRAAALLNSTGLIHVKVVTSSTALTDLSSGTLAIWAAAWTSTIDPDMYQVYHKDSTAASIKNWGYNYIMADATTYGYEQGIISQLSDEIDAARKTTNETVRKAHYAIALDYVMELAVELPTYQRKDLFAYNSSVLRGSTMQRGNDLTPYNGPLARIWEVMYI